MRVNKLVNKAMGEETEKAKDSIFQDEQELDPASLRKIHKKNTKYAEQTIMQARCDVQAAISKLNETKDAEQILKLKEQIRKLIAFYCLFIPQMWGRRRKDDKQTQ